ncbi:hypothetical protein BH11MYX3_BH11MYX3_02100 [soil metagenome]
MLLIVALAAACSKDSPAPAPAPAPVATPAAPKQAVEPWGAAVADPKGDQIAMHALSMLASGDPKASELVGDALFIGPALWAGMVDIDKQLATLGTDSKAVVKTGPTPHELSMRSFIEADARTKFLKTDAMKTIATLFAAGRPRAANELERHLLYALVPFEIAGKPVTVVETASRVTLIVVIENGKLYWLDIPGMYRPDLTVNLQ